MADPAEAARCHDCGAAAGQVHGDSCDVARCLVTGRQRLSCSTVIFPPGADPDRAFAAGTFEFGDAHPGEDCGQDVWAGRWPGAAECEEYGFWARFTGTGGWVPCDRADPGATEDLNRLVTECSWDRGQRRWIRTPPIRVEVHPACGHGWTETRPAGTARPKDGELRVCGHSACYPAQYPVTYTDLTELKP